MADWPNVFVQKNLPGHICPCHCFQKEGHFSICRLVPFFSQHHVDSSAWPTVPIQRAPWTMPGWPPWPKLLPGYLLALPLWAPHKSTWKIRSPWITPPGRSIWGGGRRPCSGRSTLSLGICIRNPGISLETSGTFQALNFPSVLDSLSFVFYPPQSPSLLFTELLSVSRYFPVTSQHLRGQLLRHHFSFFFLKKS